METHLPKDHNLNHPTPLAPQNTRVNLNHSQVSTQTATPILPMEPGAQDIIMRPSLPSHFSSIIPPSSAFFPSVFRLLFFLL